MRRNVIFLCLAGLLAGCSNNTDEIRSAAQGYLDAMGNYRPTDARPYATDETCDVTLTFFEKMMQHTDPSVYANNIPATITLGEITIEGDTLATVAFHKHTPSMEQDGEIQVVRRKGHWRVHQVIDVPGILNPGKEPRRFSEEEIAEMRKNRK